MRFIPALIAFFVFAALCRSSIAQNQHAPLTVAEAKEAAATLGSSQVLVRGHFWIGKEGSMIYDSRYKAILGLQYSPSFNAKHSFHELLVGARKSDFVTITGRLGLDSKRRSVLIADEIQFVETPK